MCSQSGTRTRDASLTGLIDDKRTTGGYPAHPDWVNAAEFTQTGHLPDPVNPGPHGDGIKAFYTALEYGGVRFAILEDRKWKSPPLRSAHGTNCLSGL